MLVITILTVCVLSVSANMYPSVKDPALLYNESNENNEYFYWPSNFTNIQFPDNPSPKFFDADKNLSIDNKSDENNNNKYFYLPNNYRNVQLHAKPSTKLVDNEEFLSTSIYNKSNGNNYEYFYSSNDFVDMQLPATKLSNTEETLSVKETTAINNTSNEYFYSPSNFKTMQLSSPKVLDIRENPSVEDQATLNNEPKENEYEYFYSSDNFGNMQDEISLINNESNGYNVQTGGSSSQNINYMKNKPPSRQVNGRILNQGVQEQLPPSFQTEVFKPSLSQQGTNVLNQLAAAISTLWYQPVMVLLDDTEEVHRGASLFMRSLLDLPQIYAEFRLMKFNSSDVSPVLADTSINKESFLNYLKWVENKNSTQTSMLIVPEALQKSAVFFGILKATNLLPSESGIIVFTDRHVEDEDLAQLAVKEMIQKNISLYVVWEGVYPTIKNEEKLLREIAGVTGGDFFVGNTERKVSQLYSNAYVIDDDARQAKDVIAIYPNITGVEKHKFPVESGVKSIHISITSPVSVVKLASPKGLVINLLNRTEVEHFSKGSFRIYEPALGQFEIQLNTAGYVPTPIVGIWRLDVDGGGLDAHGCKIIVSVQTQLNITTFFAYKLHEKDDSKENQKLKKVLRVVLSGKFGEINRISVLNKKGLAVEPNVNFTLPPKNKEHLVDVEDINRQGKQELDIDFNTLPPGQHYLNIFGEDKDGKAFSRLSYYDSDKLNYLMQPLSVEVGAGSELFVKPNQYGKIFFEVTNNRDQVMYLYFMVQDEKSHLSRMEPRSSWVNPKQTLIVTVTTYASGAPSANYRNLITFTVSGPERIQKSAAMYVSTNRINDDTDPRMWHRFTSDCTDVIFGRCEDSTWVIEVTAEDKETGLLQLTSNPKGLYFPNGYVAGTKEPVVGLYGGSCCQSKIQLTAIDLQNNRRSYTADAYKAALSAGSISAIVLGIILFIIILVGLICLCKKKCCKDKESVDLPTYRGPHGSQRRY